ncbi:putative endo-beta-1,4-glucanase [Hortaea werneckii]|nr:putative endo-beta-1,4-glucanase [Hortaea werneckii]KAI7315275.1 putative endo-beta-1,4-glucanase [Hortaea werneckii]
MAVYLALGALSLLPLSTAQQVGRVPEWHPRLKTQSCTKHGCVDHYTSVVLDALAHPIKDIYTGASCVNSSGSYDPSICPTEEECAQRCALEGIDYAQHGVYTWGDTMKLQHYINIDGSLTSVSPRVYLLEPSGYNYQFLRLLNQEFSFTVDVSDLPCGENGALYLSEMEADGGRSHLNPAGATYGTGYCDAQCPNLPWINGVANTNGSGSCCNEMDLWEANARATSYTPHPCNISSLYECAGDECGPNGVCDKSGCSFNPYALGNRDYYGYYNVVDTTEPFTVTTQFLTDDGTASGTLSEIRRLYVQHGQVIKNTVVTSNNRKVDSITDDYCNASYETFEELGGLAQMGEAIGRGMVLAFSIWNDAGQFMNWLDSGNSGPCNATEGNPEIIRATNPDTSVKFSEVRWGDIGTTYKKSHHWHG